MVSNNPIGKDITRPFVPLPSILICATTWRQTD